MFAYIQAGSYVDQESGETIHVTVSPYYSTITVGQRSWHFVKETGGFDGTSIELVSRGPILVSERSET